jgi:transposase
MRAAMNAVLYLLLHRVPWLRLPRSSFPPRSTFYNIFRKFQRDGVWEAIWAELHMALRERMGREASPSAVVLDSQSVESAEKGATETVRWDSRMHSSRRCQSSASPSMMRAMPGDTTSEPPARSRGNSMRKERGRSPTATPHSNGWRGSD